MKHERVSFLFGVATLLLGCSSSSSGSAGPSSLATDGGPTTDGTSTDAAASPACAAAWGGSGGESCTECGCGYPQWSCAISTCMAPNGHVMDLGSEAGFLTLEPVQYTKGGPQTTTTARLWYIFQPANESPETKPLVVFFNGGPGVATTSVLFSFNTARYTLDLSSGKAVPIANASSWTRFANLLYVDARQTGFSYGLADDPSSEQQRNAESSNPWADAADFIRVILRFLQRHDRIQANPVVIAGESYGGIRATVMLYVLRRYGLLVDSNSEFQDSALHAEIQEHLDRVFPESKGSPIPPSKVSKQFGRQILIQPILSSCQRIIGKDMLLAPDSPLFEVGQETGHPFQACLDQPPCDPLRFVSETCGRSLDDMSRTQAELEAQPVAVVDTLSQLGPLSTVLGVDPKSIRQLYGLGRKGAYRWVSQLKPWSSQSLEQELAPLEPWDRYLVWSTDVGFDYNDVLTGFMRRAFLDNLLDVETFVTNARRDGNVPSASIPASLVECTDYVTSAQFEATTPAGAARPGSIVVTYKAPPTSGDPPVAEPRRIRFPTYTKSGHAVTAGQGAEFADDVAAWLAGK